MPYLTGDGKVKVPRLRRSPSSCPKLDIRKRRSTLPTKFFEEKTMSSNLRMFLLALVLRLFFALPAVGQDQPVPGFPPIPIDATEDQVRQAVALVRAGPKLTPKAWPNGARVAVCLSFDVDNELLWRRNPWPVPLSQGEYGATTALPRMLDLLDRESVPASFYIP